MIEIPNVTHRLREAGIEIAIELQRQYENATITEDHYALGKQYNWVDHDKVIALLEDSNSNGRLYSTKEFSEPYGLDFFNYCNAREKALDLSYVFSSGVAFDEVGYLLKPLSNNQNFLVVGPGRTSSEYGISPKLPPPRPPFAPVMEQPVEHTFNIGLVSTNVDVIGKDDKVVVCQNALGQAALHKAFGLWRNVYRALINWETGVISYNNEVVEQDHARLRSGTSLGLFESGVYVYMMEWYGTEPLHIPEDGLLITRSTEYGTYDHLPSINYHEWKQYMTQNNLSFGTPLEEQEHLLECFKNRNYYKAYDLTQAWNYERPVGVAFDADDDTQIITGEDYDDDNLMISFDNAQAPVELTTDQYYVSDAVVISQDSPLRGRSIMTGITVNENDVFVCGEIGWNRTLMAVLDQTNVDADTQATVLYSTPNGYVSWQGAGNVIYLPDLDYIVLTTGKVEKNNNVLSGTTRLQMTAYGVSNPSAPSWRWNNNNYHIRPGEMSNGFKLGDHATGTVSLTGTPGTTYTTETVFETLVGTQYNPVESGTIGDGENQVELRAVLHGHGYDLSAGVTLTSLSAPTITATVGSEGIIADGVLFITGACYYKDGDDKFIYFLDSRRDGSSYLHRVFRININNWGTNLPPKSAFAIDTTFGTNGLLELNQDADTNYNDNTLFGLCYDGEVFWSSIYNQSASLNQSTTIQEFDNDGDQTGAWLLPNTSNVTALDVVGDHLYCTESLIYGNRFAGKDEIKKFELSKGVGILPTIAYNSDEQTVTISWEYMKTADTRRITLYDGVMVSKSGSNPKFKVANHPDNSVTFTRDDGILPGKNNIFVLKPFITDGGMTNLHDSIRISKILE